MPKRRARLRCAGGSLLTAIEMKTRLSTPRTISSVFNVISAIQICGSATHARLIGRPGRSQVTRPEDQRPRQYDVDHQHEQAAAHQQHALDAGLPEPKA